MQQDLAVHLPRATRLQGKVAAAQAASRSLPKVVQHSCWESIPQEVLQVVLRHLPRTDFDNVRLCCHTWKTAVSGAVKTVRLEFLNKKQECSEAVAAAQRAFPLCDHWQLQVLDSTAKIYCPHYNSRGLSVLAGFTAALAKLASTPVKRLDLLLHAINNGSVMDVDLTPLLKCSSLSSLQISNLSAAAEVPVLRSSLARLTGLQELRLRWPSMTGVLRQSPLPLGALTGLTRLELDAMTIIVPYEVAPGASVVGPDLSGLALLPQLRSLKLERLARSHYSTAVPPTWAWQTVLAPLTTLHHLHLLSHNVAISEAEAEAAASLPNLEAVELSLTCHRHTNNATNANVVTWAPPFQGVSKLRAVTLDLFSGPSNAYVSLYDCLEGLRQLGSLQQLSLSLQLDYRLLAVDGTTLTLATLSSLRELQLLRISCHHLPCHDQLPFHLPLDSEVLTALLGGCVALEELSFRGCVLLEEEDVSRLRQHQPLRSFHLQAVNIRNPPANHLMRLTVPAPVLAATRKLGGNWRPTDASAAVSAFLGGLAPSTGVPLPGPQVHHWGIIDGDAMDDGEEPLSDYDEHYYDDEGSWDEVSEDDDDILFGL